MLKIHQGEMKHSYSEIWPTDGATEDISKDSLRWHAHAELIWHI